jgi:DNA-binding transcriptional ArsR family regulator
VLDTRVRDVKVAASVAGFGFDREVSVRTERAPFYSGLLTIPPLLRDLSSTVRAHGFDGIVVHLNNLENLVTDAQRAAAGAVRRALRDVFLLDGYHFLLVGTPDAVREIVSPHAQLRSVFGIGRALEPLPADAFQGLLARRYTQEVRPPVAHEATRELYEAFRGDLRGTLRALDSAAHELIGLTDPPGAPIETPQLMAVLRPMLAAEAAAALSATLLEYFHALKDLGPLFTQKDLMDRWKLSQGAVSLHLRELQRLGYVQEERREGRLVLYGLTGPSRLVLGKRS